MEIDRLEDLVDSQIDTIEHAVKTIEAANSSSPSIADFTPFQTRQNDISF